MAKKIWKHLDEFSGETPTQPVVGGSEFAPQLEEAMDAIRREYGIKDDGSLAATAGDRPSGDQRQQDLRALLPDVSRRGFMRLSGAAAVFGLAGCWHEAPDTLVPYEQQPENTYLARPVYYNTVIRAGGEPRAVLVKRYDGRPIKLEGNPDDPVGGGKLGVRGQATIVDLYDPDRLRNGPRKNADGENVAADWAELDLQVGQSLAQGGVALVTGSWNGPSRLRLRDELATSLGDRFTHVAYHPFAQDVARDARAASFGDDHAHEPVYHPDEAKVMVTFGSDYLGGGTTGLADNRAFGAMRKVKGSGEHADMGQLLAFEPTVTQTGTLADIRTRVDMADLPGLAWTIAVRVAEKMGAEVPKIGREIAAQYTQGNAEHLELHPGVAHLDHGKYAQDDGGGIIAYAADQLVQAHEAGNHSLIYVGGATHCSEQSHQLFVVANYLNAILGNEGVTVETASRPEFNVDTSARAFAQLLADCQAGKVQTLLLADVDPIYDWHDPQAVRDALAQVPTVVALAERDSETVRAAHWIAPIDHDLESWGDAELTRGVFAVQQPCTRQLWNTRSIEQSLMAFAQAAGSVPDSWRVDSAEADPKQAAWISREPLWQAQAVGLQSWGEFVRATWNDTVLKRVGPVNDDGFWRSALSRGVVGRPTTGSAPGVSFNAQAVKSVAFANREGHTLVISSSRIMGAGEQANNPYLQEVGDPVSKVTWDNYLAVSLDDAAAWKLPRDAVAALTVGEQTVHVPVFVQVGMLPGTVELFTGWGRELAGVVADGGGVEQPDGGRRQINAFHMALNGARWGVPVTVSPVEDTYRLAEIQGNDYQDGRGAALDDLLVHHQKDPGMHHRGHHHSLWVHGQGTTDPQLETPSDPEKPFSSPNNLSMWDSVHVYPGRRWGMSIDLNSCTGCNACVVACSLENNVPVVGRDEIRLGREMHWIRIDRYYATTVTHEEYIEENLTESKVIEGESATDFGRLERKRYEGHNDAHFDVFHQPMLCQHCGHAPCEEVCPAMATMHSDQGVNIQVYNRCIGTRYCANNCPYKVRRFNFYEYSKYRQGPVGSGDPLARVAKNIAGEFSTTSRDEMLELPLQMLLNPAVTVRSKGVMEKCNFCVQRTRDIREHEKRSNRKYDDSDPMMTVACAQTCPTSAIIFGDINDPDSSVSQHIKAREHGYKVLDSVLNTRPSITYHRQIRNRPPAPDEMLDHHDGHAGHGDGHGGAEIEDHGPERHGHDHADTASAAHGEEAH